MKLNYRRTILVGLAFLSISAFWQLYDMVIPLILRDNFHMGDDAAGVVMALDNILALFMLPLFGRLSDGCHSRMGRRMPFIVCGTGAAVVLMMALVFAQRASLALFMVLLGLLLIAMGTYRSPAVALMPDVTPKPLRSKGNAVINLMGALGGVFTLAGIQFLVRTGADGQADYFPLFLAVALLMAVSVAVLFFRVDENGLRAQMPPEPAEVAGNAGEKLPKPMLRSLLLILFSVFFWFMGYNAVTTAYSKYFTRMWGDLSGSANCMLIATVGAVVSYLPVGALSSKLGRKPVILLGVALLAVCFFVCKFITVFTPLMYALFVVIGFAWAAINVNSYPMVVEISRGADVGKYTGYYYTFSMAAQIATPILSGFLLEHVGYHTLFPYAAGMVAVSFVTMLLVRHGDNKPEAPKSKLEAFGAGD